MGVASSWYDDAMRTIVDLPDELRDPFFAAAQRIAAAIVD